MERTESRLLLGRFLTRSGDQAWDFALPLTLLHILPGNYRLAASLYLIVVLGQIIFLPRFAGLLDKLARPLAVKFGILLQLAGVISGVVFLQLLASNSDGAIFYSSFAGLALAGIASSLGASFMEITVANDLVPATLAKEGLADFNAKIRRIDLATEVGAPVLAGLLLFLKTDSLPLLGFWLIAGWNILSFFPELWLIHSVLKDNPSLAEEKILVPEVYRQNFLNQLLTGWRAFAREPAALAMLAYSFLWLSALSPHGVLLTSFLKDGWQLPEWEIGIFRGLGAVFGLAATFLFPILVRKTGLIGGSRNCLWFQAATLLLAMGFFFLGERVGQLGFLLLILFSRIGLYGFGLGEMEIRQRSILPGSRGRVNGFAHALNNVGTLSLFVVGILVGSASAFGLLVAFSCAAVLVAAALFQRWIKFNNESFK